MARNLTTPFVVLLSDKDDLNLHFLTQVLQHRREPYVVLDPTVRSRNFDIAIEDKERCAREEVVAEDGTRWAISDVKAVWSRGAGYFGGKFTTAGTSSNLTHYESIYAYEYLWWSLRDCLWINPVFDVRHSANRLVQYRIAKQSGFDVPDQVVTTDASELRLFSSSMDKCVIKRISQGGMRETGPKPIMTEYFRHETSPKTGKLSAPVLLQAYIEKEYELRVVVVGQKVFAAAIDSSSNEKTALDSRSWQQAGLTYYRVTLPEQERASLIELNHKLGLFYSSIDLVRAKNGRLYFLEANPSGQWSFVEIQTGYPITEEIARLLIEGM